MGSLAGGQTVNRADAAIELRSSSNPSKSGARVTFSAAVSVVPPGAGAPTGTVTFLDGAKPIGATPLTGGRASLSTSTLAPGPHHTSATYGGHPNSTRTP